MCEGWQYVYVRLCEGGMHMCVCVCEIKGCAMGGMCVGGCVCVG